MDAFTIAASDVKVEPGSARNVSLSFDADKSDVIELISIKDIIDHYDAGQILDEMSLQSIVDNFDPADLLDKIGIDEAKSYFDL